MGVFDSTGIGLGVYVTVAHKYTVGATAALASVVAFTPAADGMFDVSVYIGVTVATTCDFVCTLTYTDEAGTSRVLNLMFAPPSGGALLTAITDGETAVAYTGIVQRIRAKAANAITVATSGTFTTVTYNVDGMITQVA